MKYPVIKVLLTYTLFTWLVAGILAGIPLWILAMLNGQMFGQLILPFSLIAGGIGGLLPSFLLAIYLVKSQFTLYNRYSWLKLFVIGSSFSIIGLLLGKMLNFYYIDSWLKTLLASGCVMLVYGTSVIIIGKLVLPKQSEALKKV